MLLILNFTQVKYIFHSSKMHGFTLWMRRISTLHWRPSRCLVEKRSNKKKEEREQKTKLRWLHKQKLKLDFSFPKNTLNQFSKCSLIFRLKQMHLIQNTNQRNFILFFHSEKILKKTTDSLLLKAECASKNDFQYVICWPQIKV